MSEPEYPIKIGGRSIRVVDWKHKPVHFDMLTDGEVRTLSEYSPDFAAQARAAGRAPTEEPMTTEAVRHGFGGWRLEHYQWHPDRRVLFYTNEKTQESARVTVERDDCSVRYGQRAELDWLVNSGADWPL